MAKRLTMYILAAMVAACDSVLDEVQVSWSDFPALTVVMAAKGYPAAPETGTLIRGVAEAGRPEHVTVFHAGTAFRDGELVAQGGRVLAVTALGPTIGEARDLAYSAVRAIDWPGGFYRTDIGARAVSAG